MHAETSELAQQLYSAPSSNTVQFSSVDDIIQEARHGRMFIIVDDDVRGCSGNLVIPAQMATPEAINFMARRGRGLVCLGLTARRCRELDLELQNQSQVRPQTESFTVSIEARHGVTTGISAADRARTISAAINCSSPRDIITPGHVFPLQAREGGVLARAGHTEAAVDIARLAGLNSSAVMCKILNKDGSISRTSDLLLFAKENELKLSNINSLIAYRAKYDRTIARREKIPSAVGWEGNWRAVGYSDKANDTYAVAIATGELNLESGTLVRIHNTNTIAEHLLGNDDNQSGNFQRSLDIVSNAGSGLLLVVMNSSRRSFFSLLQREENDTRSETTGSVSYSFAAQVLFDLGVKKALALFHSNRELSYLKQFGLPVESYCAGS